MTEHCIIHVDMDSYYPAVEILDNPDLAGLPVIVGGIPPSRGVVCSASYEARAFGVHSAMPVNRAFERCPEAIFLPVRMQRYAELSRQIRAIFFDYSPLVEPLSLDEAFIDLSAGLKFGKSAVEVGREIKQRIESELGLIASVGIAHNKYLAKLASDHEKPDGFCIMPLDQAEIEAFLAPMSVRKLWGVGPALEQKLLGHGLRFIANIQALSLPSLRKKAGNLAQRLHDLSRGIDHRKVIADGECKSIGAEQTFAEDIEQVEILQDCVRTQVDEVVFRMRAHEWSAQVLTVKVRYSNFKTLTRQVTVKAGLKTYDDVLQLAFNIMRERIDLDGKAVRLIGVTLSKFIKPMQKQQDLFEDGNQSAEKIDSAIEKLNKMLGQGTLTRGSLLPKNQDKRLP